MANILLPTQQLRLQEGYAKGADNVGVTNASIASRFATIQPVKSNTHIPFMINPADQMQFAKRAIGIVEQFQETQRAREKEVVYNNAVNDYTQKVNDITNAYKDEHGVNALNNYDKYVTELNNLRKSYSEVFTKHADLQQLFTVETSKLNSRATLELDNWKSNETIKAKGESLRNGVENALNTFNYNVGSPAEKKYLEEAQNAFKAYSEWNGQDEETAKAEFTKSFTENAYSVADYYRDIKSYGQALGFIERYKNMLDPDAYRKIKGRIRSAQEVERASKAGRGEKFGVYSTEERIKVFNDTVSKRLLEVATNEKMTVEELKVKNPKLYNDTVFVAQSEATNLIYNHDQSVRAFENENSALKLNIKNGIVGYILPQLKNGKNYNVPTDEDYVGQALSLSNTIPNEAVKISFQKNLRRLITNNPKEANNIIKDIYMSIFTPNLGYGTYLKMLTPSELAKRYGNKDAFYLDMQAKNVSPEDQVVIKQKLEKGFNSENDDPYYISARNAVYLHLTGKNTLSEAKKTLQSKEFVTKTSLIKQEVDKIYSQLPRENGEIKAKPEIIDLEIQRLVSKIDKDEFGKKNDQAMEVIDTTISDFNLDTTPQQEDKARDVLFNMQVGFYNAYGRFMTEDDMSKALNLLKVQARRLNISFEKHLLNYEEFNAKRKNTNQEKVKAGRYSRAQEMAYRLAVIKERAIKDPKYKGYDQPLIDKWNEDLEDLYYEDPTGHKETIDLINKALKEKDFKAQLDKILVEGK